jgi:hypothetical protein
MSSILIATNDIHPTSPYLIGPQFYALPPSNSPSNVGIFPLGDGATKIGGVDDLESETLSAKKRKKYEMSSPDSMMKRDMAEKNFVSVKESKKYKKQKAKQMKKYDKMTMEERMAAIRELKQKYDSAKGKSKVKK